MKTILFIQARENSKRFPGKVLKKLCKKSIIQIIFERMRKVKNIQKIILVTGTKSINSNLIKESQKIGLEYFCGNEHNLLDRFYQASKNFPSDYIIRVTADNPFCDYDLINHALDIFENGDYDILSNNRIKTYPVGLNFEIFTSKGIKIAWENEQKKFKNHDFYNLEMPPTKYMLFSEKFKNYDLIQENDLSKIRLTIDTPEDFKRISKILEKIYPNNQFFTLNDVINYLDIESRDRIRST